MVPVAEPVQCLPFPCKINSLDWSSHPWLAAGVGEVWGEPRPFNGAKALPYAVGLTPCEPAAVFTEGENVDPGKPPQIYNLDHFPVCCLNVWTPRGGIEWDGEAEVIVVPPPGVDCATATPLMLGQEYQFGPAANNVVYWFAWEGLTNGDSYRMRETLVATNGQPLLGTIFLQGPACVSFSPLVNTLGTFTTVDETRVLAVGDRIILAISMAGTVTATIRFRVDPA